MNLQQLRYVYEVARCGLNVSEAAEALFTSQPGVSKQIRQFESELGVDIFVRHGKRLVGITDPGRHILQIAERMLRDVDNLRQVGDEFSNESEGSLSIATTHTQARYALPKVVTRFKQEFPKVNLELHQGGPDEIVAMLRSGEADIGVATEALGREPDLAAFPFYQWHHAVIVPDGHPLTQAGPLTLQALAEWPLITYHEGYTGRSRIDAAFAGAELTPNIAITALDADVIKSYVELGLGVGIIAAMAFHPVRDAGLTLIETPELFERNTTLIALRRGHYLRDYAYRFLEYCSAELTRDTVREALQHPEQR